MNTPYFMEFQTYHFRRNEKNTSPFPDNLWKIPNPPQELFIQGSRKALDLLNQLPERGLAIVGTRNPQTRSVSFLKKWILELEGSQLIIVSGLARGIDTVAHHTAIEANLPTIAILGAGLDIHYPRQNQELRRQILESNGLIVSEFSFGTPALGNHFLKRNRLIASWSKATWVVQASVPSGALSTARWARELDLTCLAVPCSPGDPEFAGNQILLDRENATPFWGIHSLGSVWLDLATHLQRKVQPPQENVKSQYHSEIFKLLAQVRTLTHQNGGVQIHELLDWALTQNWKPEQFFIHLELAIQKKWILDRQGTLLSL